MAKKSRKPRNAAKEAPAPGLAARAAPSFAGLEKRFEWVKIGPGGRIVIAAPMRRALGLGEGSSVQLRLDGDELRMVSKEAAIRRVQDMVAKIAPDDGHSWVDALIEERRREAEAEDRRE